MDMLCYKYMNKTECPSIVLTLIFVPA